VYDHTSVLKLIEWRWGLAPLTPRDGSSDINNLAYALNFSQALTAVPSLPSPFAPAIAAPCIQNPGGVFSAVQTGSGATQYSSTAKWKDLQTMAAKYGFQVE
jgi:phospholipase C